MADELTQRRHKKEPLELQLTAMIDIFSMIVIFLILGSVMGASEMVIPPGMAPPRSISKEAAESAPRLVIGKTEVETSFFSEKFPLALFTDRLNPSTGDVERLKGRVKDFVTALPKAAKGSGALLNVIADKDTPYEDVFNVVKVFREGGFQTLLFVAIGEGKAK